MNKAIYMETFLNAEEIAASASMSASNLSPSQSITPQTLEEKWENAGIGNAFIFGKVMSTNTDLLLELLQLSLPELEIREISDAVQEVYLKTSIDAHGVRLDISVRDSRNRIFDVEMQLRDEENIPRRIRYYTGTLDQTNLKSGENYNQLKDTIIIFITPFDPFGRSRYRYTFRNICLEEKEDPLELGDGTTKVILNAKGSVGEISPSLKGFLDLVLGLQPPSDSSGSYADRVQKQVDIAKRNSVWRREYMNWEMTLSIERDKGRNEGKLLTLIQLILAKLSKGKSEDIIADEIERDVTFVHLIASLSKNIDKPTAESVFDAYKTLKMKGKLDMLDSSPSDSQNFKQLF